MDDLDFYNPDDYGLALAEAPKRRRKRRKNPESTIAIATPLLLALAGYLGWCSYRYSQTKVWSFTPWKLAGRRPLRLRQVSPAEAERRRLADLDRATEAMMRPRPSVQEVDLWKKPTYRPVTEETVSFIYP